MKILKLIKELIQFAEEEDAANKLLDTLKGVERKYYQQEYYDNFHKLVLEKWCKKYKLTLYEYKTSYKTIIILHGHYFQLKREFFHPGCIDTVYKELLSDLMDYVFDTAISKSHPALRITSTRADEVYDPYYGRVKEL